MWAQQLWLPHSGAQAQYLGCMGLAALQHVASSQIRDWTSVSCIGSWILYHWATRETLVCTFLNWWKEIQKMNVFLDMGKLYEIQVSESISKVSWALLICLHIVSGLLLYWDVWVEKFSYSRDHMHCKIQNICHLALMKNK